VGRPFRLRDGFQPSQEGDLRGGAGPMIVSKPADYARKQYWREVHTGRVSPSFFDYD